MVLDRLCESKRYENLHPRFAEAFEFLRNAADKPCGRYELGDNMFVNISDVATHEPGTGMFEAHRRYIDIQYLFDGHSAFVWAHTPELTVKKTYDEAADIEFLEGPGAAIPVRGGDFYILYPSDAHEPHQTHGAADSYRVAVVKVPV